MITGAQLFVKALQQEQVDTLFAYPGGQAIDLFHALYGVPDIRMIIPRHEQGLIHAADGYARSTKKVGVCLVTSGPGATNLVTGIATAAFDSVPLVCFTGQVATTLIGRESFQEVDIVDITKSLCKYAVTVQTREELASVIQKAFSIAQSGRPGVVLVDLPKDIQQAYGSETYISHKLLSPVRPKEPALYQSKLKEAAARLQTAKRPVFLIGGGVSISGGQAKLCHLAELTGVPVVTTIMGKGSIPSTHPLYVGTLGIHGSYAANHAIDSCDLLLSIGTRFNDRITGKTSRFAPHAAIIHIDIDPANIGKNIPVHLPIVADAKKALTALLEAARPQDTSDWRRQIEDWKKCHPLNMTQKGLTPEHIMNHLNESFEHAIFVTDVGQNQLWAAQFLTLNEQKTLLTSGGMGTMGYGLPAGLGAKLGNESQHVIVITGDGGMQMNLQELATAVCYELPVIICILNNGYLGNVRQWQELFYEKKYSGTCMRYRKSCKQNCNEQTDSCRTDSCPPYTPDFISLANSYGAFGIRICSEEEIAPALAFAKKEQKVPVILEFIIDSTCNVLPIIPPGRGIDDMMF